MSDCTQDKEPPYAEPHVRWCERSENESRKITTSFSSYSICFQVMRGESDIRKWQLVRWIGV